MAATAAQLPLYVSSILPNFRHRISTTFLSSPFIKQKSLKFWKVNERSSSKSTVDDAHHRVVELLYEDLYRLFNDQVINRTAFDERIKFRDPLTKYDTIGGYIFYIALLKILFKHDCLLHWAKQTGPYEITLRWTVLMTFMLLPWKPELAFTGTTLMGINPETGKFNSHVDTWDSVKNNDYFSLEGAWDVFIQLRMYKTPDLETPKYQILKRAADYELRKYSKFVVVETQGDKLSESSAGFNSVAGYIFGKNSKEEKIPMTTPVFTETNGAGESNVIVQIVLPEDRDLDSLPDPSRETIRLKKVGGGNAAALKFSGRPTEDIIKQKERELRDSLIRDGLKPRKGCVFARYNDPSRTWEFIMRNEVLIWLEDFRLDS